MSSAATFSQLVCGGRVLDLSTPRVMGILNVTPDSFSDGGRYQLVDQALQHAELMVQSGAALIDVGGESTRPGAARVGEAQELDRVAPVIEAIAAELDVIISVDTSSAAVMLEAAKLGAGFINDVRALTRDGALQAAAQTGLPVCLMHMRGEPENMQQQACYKDLLADVCKFLVDRMDVCENAGITQERIVLDPGFGFAKTLEHNLSLFKRLEQLSGLGRPLLVGASRKSMIGAVLRRENDQRLYGSLALAALAMFKGASILRVHDVAETMDVVRMLTAVTAAQ